ncbi:hypothetical protein AJ79_00508 [Helicocarpus griseus UAMH5409]|uniref:Uncharacterized protein n=1 Tax=Helicocarpus griseus UAMH5409 TaxID=1447875 RepID=A0A2B7YBH2_9EURO|nr:hypothetical protein AJ79_00508 [Helicocarpus griseus UAMH5409]
MPRNERPTSDSSYDGKVEEANVSIKADVKTLNQLSSSGKAAQENRRGKGNLGPPESNGGLQE